MSQTNPPLLQERLRPEAHVEEANRRPNFQGDLVEALANSADFGRMLETITELLKGHAELVALLYFERSKDGSFSKTYRLVSGQDPSDDRIRQQLIISSHHALNQRQPNLRIQSDPHITFVAAPIHTDGTSNDTLAAAFGCQIDSQQAIELVEFTTTQIAFWLECHASSNLPPTEDNANTVDTTASKDDTPIESITNDPSPASRQVNIQAVWQSDSTKISASLAPSPTNASRLLNEPVSPEIAHASSAESTASLDLIAETLARDASQIEDDALDAIELVQELIDSSETTSMQSNASVVSEVTSNEHSHAEQTLRREIAFESKPVEGPSPEPVILVTEPARTNEDDSQATAGEALLAPTTGLCQDAYSEEPKTAATPDTKHAKAWQESTKLKIALSVAVCILALFVPVPHQVRCESVVRSVQRSVVSSPLDATLSEVLVAPGQKVTKGQILAKLAIDPVDEVRARLRDELEQAVQERESARAYLRTAEQQLAQLESERIEARIKMLNYRTQATEIRSPIDGIVENSHVASMIGGKLCMGAPLFEVIPIDRMVVEAAVPESLISFIAPGQPVSVDYASQTSARHAKLDQLPPRSELRDGANVFVAKFEVDNRDEKLRPGMSGRTFIQTGNRSLGWVTFHRWLEVISKAFAW